MQIRLIETLYVHTILHIKSSLLVGHFYTLPSTKSEIIDKIARSDLQSPASTKGSKKSISVTCGSMYKSWKEIKPIFWVLSYSKGNIIRSAKKVPSNKGNHKSIYIDALSTG